MKYFVPQLLNDPVVNHDDEAWDKAFRGYERHISEIRSLLSAAGRDLLGFVQDHDLHDETLLFISYCATRLTAEIRISKYRLQFSKVQYMRIVDDFEFDCEWLYEEVDLVGGESFELSVLTTGGELNIAAREFCVSRL